MVVTRVKWFSCADRADDRRTRRYEGKQVRMSAHTQTHVCVYIYIYIYIYICEGESNENLKSAISIIHKYLRFSFDSSSYISVVIEKDMKINSLAG